MQDRLIEFVQALRGSGVRVSLAESADCMRAIEALGVEDREAFRSALRTTLVKEHPDFPTFDRLFPLFFTVGAPPMQPMSGQGGEDELDEQQQEQLSEAMQQLQQQLSDKLRQLAQRLMEGQAAQPRGAGAAGPADRYAPDAAGVAAGAALGREPDAARAGSATSSSSCWSVSSSCSSRKVWKARAASRYARWPRATPRRWSSRSSSSSARSWQASWPSI